MSTWCSAAVAQQDDPQKPYGLTERIPWTTSRVVGRPEPPPPYEARRVYPRLKLKEPVFIAQEPGTDRLLVAQLDGKIYAFPKSDPHVAFADDDRQHSGHPPDLFLDTGRQIYAFSFHPQYDTNGQIFVFSPTDPKDKSDEKRSRVSRFTATHPLPRESEGRRRADPATEEIIIEWPAGGHNGGEAIIGPDGYLYICTGDGTSDSDGNNTGQGVDDLLAVMMRIDVENPDPGRAYSIPKDNPFVDYPGARPEIWAFGFRNPWRMSFDAETGRLWVGDVGQDLWEMVRVVERGGNYGWSVQEGTHPFRLDRRHGPGPILPPVVEHHHTECRSITGGYVYYGEKFPELNGVYFYGDYEYGKIWGLRYDGQKVTWHEELADTALRPPSFAVTRDGQILILDHLAGEIYSLERNDAADESSKFPRKLSETGIFASVENHTPAPGVIPFSVNTPAWHDGALAERLLAMPGTSQIEFVERSTDANTWKFEDGTVTVQTLSLETQPHNPSSRRRIETRIVVKQQDHWLGYSYLWNDEQTDASLVDANGLDLMLNSQSPDGEATQQPWHIPARTECMVCHSRAAGFVLGLNTLQMNREHDYGEVADNQLRAFDHVGIFKKPLEKSPEEYSALPDSYSQAADLYDRARAYLYVNCSVCHVLAGGGNAQMELRYETPPRRMKLFDVEPLHDNFGLENAHLVTSGDPYSSVLFYRMAALGRARMPRVASNVPDDDALNLMYEWILSLEPSGAEQGGAPAPAQQAEAAARRSLRAAARATEPAAQASALANLLADTRTALVLYRLMTTDQVPRELRQPLITAAASHPDLNVRDLFERFVPPSRRRKRLGTNVDTEELLALRGDAERGRQAFLHGVATQCKTCHTINGTGGPVGPDLSGIGKKYTRAQLLESILQPSKQIEPKYTAFLLLTSAGQVYTGLLEERTDKEVALRDANGKLIRVPAGEVEELEPQKQSLMPEQALRDFTAQEAADLLEFLATLKAPSPDPKSSAVE